MAFESFGSATQIGFEGFNESPLHRVYIHLNNGRIGFFPSILPYFRHLQLPGAPSPASFDLSPIAGKIATLSTASFRTHVSLPVPIPSPNVVIAQLGDNPLYGGGRGRLSTWWTLPWTTGGPRPIVWPDGSFAEIDLDPIQDQIDWLLAAAAAA